MPNGHDNSHNRQGEEQQCRVLAFTHSMSARRQTIQHLEFRDSEGVGKAGYTRA